MSTPEIVSMTPDGSVRWRRYRERGGYFFHPVGVPAEEVAKVRHALAATNTELVSARGKTADISKYGQLVLKRYRPVLLEPQHAGRFENFRMNVALTHALRDRPRVAESRWRLRGPRYHGAFIGDNDQVPTIWAMEYIDGRALTDIIETLPRSLAVSILPSKLEEVTWDAAEAGGIAHHLYEDEHNGNYIVPRTSIEAFQDKDTDLELVRIDVGSYE